MASDIDWNDPGVLAKLDELIEVTRAGNKKLDALDRIGEPAQAKAPEQPDASHDAARVQADREERERIAEERERKRFKRWSDDIDDRLRALCDPGRVEITTRITPPSPSYYRHLEGPLHHRGGIIGDRVLTRPHLPDRR